MTKDLNIHLVYPFSKLFSFWETLFMPKQLIHFYWYMVSIYTISIEVQTIALRISIRNYIEKKKIFVQLIKTK